MINNIPELQITGSNTKEDDEAYIELGNILTMNLISFAYQISSGMVKFTRFYKLF